MKKKQTEIKLYRIFYGDYQRKRVNEPTFLVIWLVGDENNKKIIKINRSLKDVNKVNDIILTETKNKDYKITKKQYESALNNANYKRLAIDADFNCGEEIDYDAIYDKKFTRLNISNGKLLNYDNILKTIINCITQKKIEYKEGIKHIEQKVETKYKIVYKWVKAPNGFLFINSTNRNIEIINEEYNKINNSNIKFNYIDFLSSLGVCDYSGGLPKYSYKSIFIRNIKIYYKEPDKSYFCFNLDLYSKKILDNK